ncbi:hypothetical protein B0H10DRAFT_2202023 [Mycena sp. CBHHK59/15]|nr:hypothetical protein B0H10DRAFT_2202023 [Mycena sp. CBHHK59/15]
MATGAEIGALLAAIVKIAPWSVKQYKKHSMRGQIERGQDYLDKAVERLNDPKYKEPIEAMGSRAVFSHKGLLRVRLEAQNDQLLEDLEDLKLPNATRSQAKNFRKNARDHWLAVKDASDRMVYVVRLRSNRYSLSVLAHPDNRDAPVFVVVTSVNAETDYSNFCDVDPHMREDFDRIASELEANVESIASGTSILEIGSGFRDELALLGANDHRLSTTHANVDASSAAAHGSDAHSSVFENGVVPSALRAYPDTSSIDAHAGSDAHSSGFEDGDEEPSEDEELDGLFLASPTLTRFDAADVSLDMDVEEMDLDDDDGGSGDDYEDDYDDVEVNFCPYTEFATALVHQGKQSFDRVVLLDLCLHLFAAASAPPPLTSGSTNMVRMWMPSCGVLAPPLNVSTEPDWAGSAANIANDDNGGINGDDAIKRCRGQLDVIRRPSGECGGHLGGVGMNTGMFICGGQTGCKWATSTS